MNEPHTITSKITAWPRKTHCIPITPLSLICPAVRGLCCVSWPWSDGVEEFSVTLQAGADNKT